MRIHPRARLRTLFVLSLALVAGSCRDVAQLMALSAGIGTTFESRDVSTNLQNRTQLTVVFDNSPLGDYPDAVRAATARRVAEYVRDHYPGYGRLEQVTIEFNSVSPGSGFTTSSLSGSYSFTPADLGPPPAP